MISDTYFSLAQACTGEFRDRGSKFLTYAFPIRTESEWQQRLEELRKMHPKANHHCYAWRLGLDGNLWRANDDGEPAGTAGKPILGQIDSFRLTYVCVVVVRYFGGTLLGAGGLIHAYKTSAMEALRTADIREYIVYDHYQLDFDYSLMNNLMNAISQLQLIVVDQAFDERASIVVAVRKSLTASSLLRLKAIAGQLYLEEVDEKTVIPGLEISYLRTV